MTTAETHKKSSSDAPKSSKSKARKKPIPFGLIDNPNQKLKEARLSDPDMEAIVARTVKRLSRYSDALQFLQEIGFATPTGRLTKKYGG